MELATEWADIKTNTEWAYINSDKICKQSDVKQNSELKLMWELCSIWSMTLTLANLNGGNFSTFAY